MSLFDKIDNDEKVEFPTEPAFIVPVEVRDTPQYGVGHKGVFSLTDISSNTKFWIWTDRIEQIPSNEIESYIVNIFGNNIESIQTFLRQGFVLPTQLDTFHSNPTDAGRYMNHSNNPNCGPDGTLRDVKAGEELTMDYSFHGNPEWYQNICKKYNVKTEAEIAATAATAALTTDAK